MLLLKEKRIKISEENYVKNGWVLDKDGCFVTKFDSLSLNQKIIVLNNQKSDKIPL